MWEEISSNNRKIIKPLELDIYIEDYNLAIEYTGLLYHSIWKDSGLDSVKDNIELESELKNYHVNKTNVCESKWIQLLHIFENEWDHKWQRGIWKSILLQKLNNVSNKVYARKCVVKLVDFSEAKIFLEQNHLQGNINSWIRLWLYHNDELVQLMTFGKSRYNTNYDWELYRLASKKYTQGVWGTSKLFKYFINNYLEQNQSIITYADRRYSQWKVYKILWFKLTWVTIPNYFYFKWTHLESRIKYQKHKLKDILENFDETLTESQNMYNNGYRKIYDCWNLVFVYKKE